MLVLNRVFSELIGTNFNSQFFAGIGVGLKRLLIFTNTVHSWPTNTSSEKLCHKWTCTKTCYHSA